MFLLRFDLFTVQIKSIADSQMEGLGLCWCYSWDLYPIPLLLLHGVTSCKPRRFFYISNENLEEKNKLYKNISSFLLSLLLLTRVYLFILL